MFVSSVNSELREKVAGLIAETPSMMPSKIAGECGVSEAVAVAALPEHMRTFVSAEHFDEVWQEMREWSLVTFIVASPGAIVEVKGRLPRGVHGHVFFNLMEKGHPLGGHLPVNQLGEICFLEKEFFGLKSQSVQFYNKEGQQMFAIYVGREKKVLIPEIEESFVQLKKKLTEED